MNENIERSIGRIEGKLDIVIQDMANLKSSFETLESGRLSHLEIAFASFKAQMTAEAKIAALWISILTSISTAVAIAVIIKFLHL